MAAAGFPALARRLARGVALLATLLAANVASALSIGEIELRSRVGEPLRAVVPLGNLGSLSQNDILVGRAAEDVYRAYGVDRASYNSPLRFELLVDAKGNASVSVSTEQPVAEPFVDMVLEVRWPTGRAVKQFTLLLDLPAH
jgi:pilus assembly protein FimV